MARVLRFDVGSIRGVETTPTGGLRVPAALTRTGVFRYVDSTGKEVREWRPPEEVFAADSLATLRGAPITDLHPTEPVTSETWAALAKGHVCDSITAEGDLVVADVIVQDAVEVELVKRKERVELSCGYSCETDDTPGTSPDGEPYDRVQRSIRYNHVALGPRDWGRAGPDVALRMDDARQVIATKETSMALKALKVRGVEHRLDGDAGVDEAQKAVADMEAEKAKSDMAAADAAAQLKALEEQKAALEGQIAALKAQIAQPVTEADVPPMVQDSLVAKRIALFEKAARVLGGEAKLDGKSADEIKRMALERAKVALPKDASPAYVDGAFEALSMRSDAFAASVAGTASDTTTSARADGGADASGDYDPREKMERRRADGFEKGGVR
jgi:hypothetical protein